MVLKSAVPAYGIKRAGPRASRPPSTSPVSVSKVRATNATPSTAHGFVDVYRAEPLARLRLIKDGVPADHVDRLAREMGMPKERLLPALGLSPATVNRRARESGKLSTEASERVIGMARMVGQVQAMVDESGDPGGFNAPAWVARWLDEPLPALGGQRPAELMDTAEGQAIVSNLLTRIQSGAHA